jgi:predicted MFS family arabinose efflux permease
MATTSTTEAAAPPLMERAAVMAERPRAGGATATAAPSGLLPLLGMLTFLVALDQRAIAPVLPQIAGDFGASVTAAGLAMTAYLLPYGLCQLVYGPLADRVGAMRVITVAGVAYALAVFAGAVVPDLGALIVARLAAGGLAAAFFPLALATIGNLVPYAERQGAVATLLAAFAAGQVMSAGLGGLLAQALSWRATFVVAATLLALLLVPLWRFRHATSPGERPPGAPFAAHWSLLRDPRALGLLAVVLIEGLLYFGATGYLGALLHERDGLSLGVIGLLLALDGLATLLVSRGVVRLRRRLGEDRLMLGGGLLMGGGFLLALAVPDWRATAVAVVALGGGFALFHSTIQTRATELAPGARGTAISLFAFALTSGAGLGTALLGGLLAQVGFDAVLLVAGVGLALLGLLAPRLTRPRPA